MLVLDRGSEFELGQSKDVDKLPQMQGELVS